MKRVVGIEFELSRNFLLCTVCAHFVLLLYVSVFLIISLKDSELVCFWHGSSPVVLREDILKQTDLWAAEDARQKLQSVCLKFDTSLTHNRETESDLAEDWVWGGSGSHPVLSLQSPDTLAPSTAGSCNIIVTCHGMSWRCVTHLMRTSTSPTVTRPGPASRRGVDLNPLSPIPDKW